MAELASENCVKVNKRSWNPVGSFGNPPSMVCSMTLVLALFKKMLDKSQEIFGLQVAKNRQGGEGEGLKGN